MNHYFVLAFITVFFFQATTAQAAVNITGLTVPLDRAGDFWNSTCNSATNITTHLLCDRGCADGDVLLNVTTYCVYGCATNGVECNDPLNVPSEIFMLAVLSLLGIAALYVFIATKFDDDWGIVHIMFFILALLYVLSALGLLASYFMFGQNALESIMGTMYYVGIYTVIVFMSYIFIRMLHRVLINMAKTAAEIKSAKRSEREGMRAGRRG